MADSGAIRAGRAFVELFTIDHLSRGLKDAEGRLKAFGAGISAIGGKIAALGAIDLAKGLAGLGALGGAALSFGQAGTELAHMSERTGASVEALSALKFAAGQAGIEFETLEGGIRKMERTIGEAEMGSKKAGQALSKLGVSLKELQGLTPDQQLALIGERLAAIADSAQRTALAMQILGKQSGPAIAAQAGNFAQAAQQARALGLVMSKEDAESALKFTQALTLLKAQLGGIVKAIGGAVAPVLTQLVADTVPLLAGFASWIKANKDLVVTLLKVSAASVGFGVLQLALGGALKGFGSLIGLGGSTLGILARLTRLSFAGLGGGVGVALAPIRALRAALAALTSGSGAGFGVITAAISGIATAAGVVPKAFTAIAAAANSAALGIGRAIGTIPAILSGIGSAAMSAGSFIASTFAAGSAFAGRFLGLLYTLGKVELKVLGGMAASLTNLPALFGAMGSAMAAPLALLTAAPGAIGAGLLTLMSPLALIVGGIVGLGAAFFTLTDTGRGAAAAIGAAFKGFIGWLPGAFRGAMGALANLGSAIAQPFMAAWPGIQQAGITAWGGIVDAVSSGDLAGAARIAWLGIKAIWVEGVGALRELWGDFQDWLAGLWEGLQSNWIGAVSTIQLAWANVVAGLKSAWVSFAGFFEEVMAAITLDNLVLSLKMAWNGAIAALGYAWDAFCMAIKYAFIGVIGSVIGLWKAFAWAVEAIWNRVRHFFTGDTAEDREAGAQQRQQQQDAIGQELEGKKGAIGADYQEKQQQLAQGQAATKEPRNQAKQDRLAQSAAATAEARDELELARGEVEENRLAKQADLNLANQATAQKAGSGGAPGIGESAGAFGAAALRLGGAQSEAKRHTELLKELVERTQQQTKVVEKLTDKGLVFG